ncbi:T9SS type A sorting domain-containing protein [Polaribacter sp.]|uniref:T9SS type A sorting domain-containing protein n=1 Tax=Polaribacter sp. TaxID=1920175 RepID=UPI003EF40877
MKALYKNVRLPINHTHLFGFLLLFFLSFATTKAQSIQQLEYYFGNDPGFGNGTMVTTTANTGSLTQALTLPTTGLNEGFHKLTIRAQDNVGTWGLYKDVTFYISEDFSSSDPISNLAGAEYWFDADPGQGNGNALTITGSPSETTENFVIPLGTLTVGFHTIGLRTQNLDGAWSFFSNKAFYVSEEFSSSDPVSNLAGAEYWFDTDPGQGNANAIAITSSPSQTTENFVIPLGTLDSGFHNVSLRTQNLDGTWGMYDKKIFYVSEEINGSDPVSNLAGAEYWFGTDPGQGNATALAITGSPSETSQNFVLPLGTLETGFHKVGLRTQNLDGTWGMYDKKIFYVFKEQDNAPAAAITEAEFLYDAELGFGTGTAAAITATANPDEYVIEIPTDLVTCDMHDIWLSVKNADGNYALYQIALDVDVFDNLPPTIVVFPNITAELDANGQASITIADVDNGTFDDCQLVSVVLNETQFNYTCANLGTNTVTITATDAKAKVSTKDVTITVLDVINPVAKAQNITVQLGANGTIVVDPSEVDNGSTDNCGIASSSLDVASFTCANLGANTVTFTVKDSSGNSNNATATITVEDTVKPTVITQNITVQLDAYGNASITANEIDNNSTDNCTIISSSIDMTTFTCANLGDNTVTLSVTDQSNNTGTATAIVTVEDTIKPTVITQNITVQLDASGNATIAASQIENGSTDNCSIASSSLDITSFSCDNIGANTVTLSVKDQSNNTGTATAIVTVVDSIKPTAITQNITVQLDANGAATITADEIDNSSTDNCSIATKSIDITNFTCANLGANTVTLTVADASNNSDAKTAIVTVEDTIKPTVITQNITVQLDASGNATITASQIENGSTDNCSIASSSLDITSFSCDNIGENTVTLSVKDQSNNTGTATAIVTVVDNIKPTAITQNITVQLDANGAATITADEIDNSSTDNCSIATKTLDITNFTCANLGANTVTLTVADASNNSDAKTAIVTVEDTVKPTAIGKDITVDLDGNASVTITANDVDNGSSDNCNFTLSIDVDTFTLEGVYPVVLTVTDSDLNTNSATIMVTVTDKSLSIKVADTPFEFNIYPVPTKEILHISSDKTINTITVFDLNGKLVLNIKKPKQNQIQVSDLSNGVYMIKINTENESSVKYFIKE